METTLPIEEFKIFFEVKLEELLKGQEEEFTENLSTGDIVDLESQEKENLLQFRLKSRDNVYLKKIKLALDRIENGTFGKCTDCGADISLSRLKARPVAEVCIHCKEEEEKRGGELIHKNRHSILMGTNNIIHLNEIRQQKMTINFSNDNVVEI